MRDAVKIDETDTGLHVMLGGNRRLTVARKQLPEAFLKWQSEARLRMFDLLEAQGAHAAHSHPAHLPVLATLGDGLFPINLACKGIGLLPRKERLAELTESFEGLRADVEARPWHETLPQRLAAARSFYGDPANFDPWSLGGLEIFEGQTARNLAQHPLAALLYFGEAPTYPSYQLAGVVRRVEHGDPAYRFLVAARELFAQDAFHLRQQRYPFGFVFNVVDWQDKTPYSRGE
ncbi:MAG: hypothetical protein ACOX6T_03165 [Myxococcales bacterium]|jgi:hypothetical protein